MNTGNLLHQALRAMADSQDLIVPDSGDPLRKFAERYQSECSHVWADDAPECAKCGAGYFEVNPLVKNKELPF
jgi:hypothetical protein